MADGLLQKLEELKAVDEDIHWFCPRVGPEDVTYHFEEDLHKQPGSEDDQTKKRRLRKVREANERKNLAFECFQVLAYDGPDAAGYKDWIINHLKTLMTCCDVCIRVFHQARGDLRQNLEEHFDAEQVVRFLQIFDDMNLDRIKQGLDEATNSALELPPEERGIGAVEPAGLFAIFETLSCEPLLRNEQLLSRHFDQPFRLIQPKRRLKLNDFVPALSRFLFDANEYRYNWAYLSWKKLRLEITSESFRHAIQSPLFDAMVRVQPGAVDVKFLPAFWNGVRMITSKLDENLIAHSLRGMDLDIYRFALDHCQFESDHLADLLATLEYLLHTAPNTFWDSMGTISPVTVAEQVFNSPSFERLLRQPSQDNPEEIQQLLSWIKPFQESIKTENQTPACRSLTSQLLGRLQSEQYASVVRLAALECGLRVLHNTLWQLNQRKHSKVFVGTATVADMLDVVKQHLPVLLPLVEKLNSSQGLSEDSRMTLQIVQRAVALDCLSLSMVRDKLLKGEHFHRDTGSKSAAMWQEIVRNIKPGNQEFATHVLLGARGIVGLETFKVKFGFKLSQDQEWFNTGHDRLSGFTHEILERLADFSDADLDRMLRTSHNASGIVSTLFSSSRETREAAIGLLKVVSFEDTRRGAIGFVLERYLSSFISSAASAVRVIESNAIFAPASSMLKLCIDMVDALSNSQNGLLRSRTLSTDEAAAVESFWKMLWQSLTTMFQATEKWSYTNDKHFMMDFCRDTMQFAEILFEEYSIFASAVEHAACGQPDTSAGARLLEHPKITMTEMVKWLRLRDDYLVTKSVTLVSNLLVRLRDASIDVGEDALEYIQNIIEGILKAKVSLQQKAELRRALETHLGHPIVTAEEEREKIAKAPKKQGSISGFLQESTATYRTKSSVAGDQEEARKKAINEGSSSLGDNYRKRLAAKQAAATTKKSVPAKEIPDPTDFKRQRALELEAKKKRDAAALAAARRGTTGPLRDTAEAGSGLKGIGVVGKDHSEKGTGLMLSSDEEGSSDEDDLDRDLFGLTDKKPKRRDTAEEKGLLSVKNLDIPRGPVKKQRQVRSARDMRARLAPDLTPLHKQMLSWDYFHDGDFPPGSRPDLYNVVPNKFRTPVDYQNVFQPLLVLEAWQGFVKAREESNFKSYEIKVTNRTSVDMFVEVGSTMTHQDNKEISIMEGDVCLLSRASRPADSPDHPHCLARVWRITRKKGWLEILYRVVPGNPLMSAFAPNGTVHGVKIQSITPLEREYGALLGLQYYDLCDEIIKAKPSPLLKYGDKQLDPIISNYTLNKAQAKAVKSAMDNDAFTLIQGPPGSGKTKTIVAIVGAILTNSLGRDNGTAIQQPKGMNAHGGREQAPVSKKLLVCAPSNAAVDELVTRFKDGVKTTLGQFRKINIVRLGRSDAINANVRDVTLEELVNAKLNVATGPGSNQREETQKLMKEHQAISERVREAREKLDAGELKGQEASKLQDDFNGLRRRKALLGTQIDNAKDTENTMNRTADLNRRRVQQSILDEAHVICGTLSGSGHEMFQNLNIEFETVVVDEAAQCVEMSALIPLKYGCAKCILVGDPKQLPPTVFSREAARFQYEQSLFVRMQSNHPEDVHLLDTQYRMHPEISVFPSNAFYDGRLLDGGDMATLRQQPWHSSALLGPYRFFDVEGQHQAASRGHSLINNAEIEVALQLFERLATDYSKIDFRGKIGIITPYKSQLRELKDRFSRQYGQDVLEAVEFNTTDAFQGRESEIIIFSCVRASPAGGIGFLQDIRRMNVGLTRAKSSLWVLGNSTSLMKGEYWRKLIEDAMQRDRYTKGNVLQMLRKPGGGGGGGGLVSIKNVCEGVGNVPTGPRRMPASAAPNAYVKTESRESPVPVPVKIKMERAEQTSIPKRKMSVSSDDDVEMKDAPSPDASDRTATSGRSTPAVEPSRPNGNLSSKNSSRDSTPLVKLEGKPNGIGNNLQPPRPPTMPPKRRKEADPFIRPKPKKPKPNR